MGDKLNLILIELFLWVDFFNMYAFLCIYAIIRLVRTKRLGKKGLIWAFRREIGNK